MLFAFTVFEKRFLIFTGPDELRKLFVFYLLVDGRSLKRRLLFPLDCLAERSQLTLFFFFFLAVYLRCRDPLGNHFLLSLGVPVAFENTFYFGSTVVYSKLGIYGHLILSFFGLGTSLAFPFPYDCFEFS
jgi:hypothetical protein